MDAQRRRVIGGAPGASGRDPSLNTHAPGRYDLAACRTGVQNSRLAQFG